MKFVSLWESYAFMAPLEQRFVYILGGLASDYEMIVIAFQPDVNRILSGQHVSTRFYFAFVHSDHRLPLMTLFCALRSTL